VTVSADQIVSVGNRLGEIARGTPHAIYDVRIDSGNCAGDDSLLEQAKHQALMRTYQMRYVLLPEHDVPGSITERLARHYDPAHMATMAQLRYELESELIEPLLTDAGHSAEDLETFISQRLPTPDATDVDAFITFVDGNPMREHHYRHFLVQSSSDLLAEASASAFGVIGEFGAPQSALFRILIDEFGDGEHTRKHSVLFRNVMRDFGLSQEYNAYWPLFDTVTLRLHNAIHFLFQNARHIFGQIGFLLYAEAAYRLSTQNHWRHLAQFHPGVDSRYFSEHAQVDQIHSRMMLEEVARPLVARFGSGAAHEMRRGAEMISRLFGASSSHLIAVGKSFDRAYAEGEATYGLPDMHNWPATVVTPKSLHDDRGDERVQVGGIGIVTSRAFRHFPHGAIGRRFQAYA
jgi:Iron-containing redox enzyme